MANAKVYLVTGATSGIGRAVAMELAKTADVVILVARDEARGIQVQNEILSITNTPNIDLQLCDLGILSSVRNLATIVSNRYDKLDVLVNSASVYKHQRTTTVDGYETMFATNHLGPFLLTNMLLDRLRASGSGRIINITAPATSLLHFDDLQSEKQFNSLNAFGATKMANLLFTFELARRLQNTGITVNAVHPGLVRSSLMKEAILPIRLLMSLFASTPRRAAKEIVELATAPEFAHTHGKFLRHGKEIEPPAAARDTSTQERLWAISEQLSELNLAHGEPSINDPHLSDAHPAR